MKDVKMTPFENFQEFVQDKKGLVPAAKAIATHALQSAKESLGGQWARATKIVEPLLPHHPPKLEIRTAVPKTDEAAEASALATRQLAEQEALAEQDWKEILANNPPPKTSPWGDLASNYPSQISKNGITFWVSGEGSLASDAIDATVQTAPREILQRMEISDISLVAHPYVEIKEGDKKVSGKGFSIQIPLQQYEAREGKTSDRVLLKGFVDYAGRELTAKNYATAIEPRTLDSENRPVIRLTAVPRPQPLEAVPA